MTIQVSEASVATVLYGTDLYQVPLYQRDFAWTKEEMSQFWIDVERSFREPEPYFFGSIILVGTDKNTLFEVLDGQQRLAAFSLLLAAARDEFPADDGHWRHFFVEGLQRLDIGNAFGGGLTHRVHLNRRDDEFFKSIVTGSNPGAPKCRSHRLLLTGYELLRGELRSLIRANGHEAVGGRLQKALAERLRAIKIVMSDAANAQMVFEAVNSAGLDLSQADLVKNHILRTAQQDVESLYYKWEELVARIEESREQVTDFVRTSYISRHSFVRKQELYKTIRASVGHEGRIPSERFLNGLLDDATFWNHLRTGALQLPPPYRDRVVRDVADLKAFNVRLAGPPLLAIQQWVLEKPEHLARAVRWLRDFFVRYSVVGGLPSNVIEEDFSKWAIDIRHGQLDLDGLHDRLLQKAPRDEAFRDYFRAFSPGSQQVARIVLARINDHAGRPNLITQTLETGGRVHLEHVIPRSPDNWRREIAQFEDAGLAYDDVVGNIANLTLLPPTINVEIGNLPFSQKRWAYEGKSGPEDVSPSSPAPINEMLARFDRFGPQEFEERRDWLAEQAIAVWSLR